MTRRQVSDDWLQNATLLFP